jgi:hypothetical protein
MDPEKHDVWIVIGSKPGEERRPIECYLSKEGADAFLMRGMAQTFVESLGALEPGGTISLIVNRGLEPTDEEKHPSSGSFVINNPDGARQVWDFTVLPFDAEAHKVAI